MIRACQRKEIPTIPVKVRDENNQVENANAVRVSFTYNKETILYILSLI